eukprot:scpid59733/ scgid6272/ 
MADRSAVNGDSQEDNTNRVQDASTQKRFGQGMPPAVSASSPMINRDRRTSLPNGDMGGARWNGAKAAGNSTFMQRGQQPVASSFDASRYSRQVGQGPGSVGVKAKPPLRRSQSSMLHSIGTAGRYIQPTGTGGGGGGTGHRQSFQADTIGALTQTYPVRQQNRQESTNSLFSRGAGGVSRFIPTSDSGGANLDDDVFASNGWSPALPTLQIYAKQLQHPRSGIPSKEQMVKGVKAMVFNGSDAAEWFMLSADGVHLADQAQALGQKLVDLGLIAAVSDDSPDFRVSSTAWFYFCHASNFTNDGETKDGQPHQNGDTNEDKKGVEGSKACIIL